MFSDISDKARSLARIRGTLSEHRGSVDGGPLSMLYFGNGSNRPFLLQLFFGGHCESRDLGAFNVWRASSCSRHRAESADLVVFDMPWPWEVDFTDDVNVVEVPAWVRQSVKLPRDKDAFLRGLHRSVRGEQLRKIRKYGLSARLTRDVADIRRFYRTMLVPYVERRFGAAAVVVPEDHAVDCARRGALLQVVHENRVIAGSVLCETNGSLQSLWTGFDTAGVKAMDGATAALFYFLIEHAFAHGITTVDYCGSRPLLSDGVFETKRRWGAAIHDDWSLESLLLRINRLTPAVECLLGRSPWITRQDGKLIGKIFVRDALQTRDDLDRKALKLASHGLDGLHIYALRGTDPSLARAVDTSGIPVTLFDLRHDDDPLTTYCDR